VKRALAVGAASAFAARGAYAALRRWPPAGAETWTRTNHRGEFVTLLEGPALAAGAVTAQLVSAAVTSDGARSGPSPARGDLAVAVAGLGALGFGVLDDLRGSGQRRGLRGHLGALAHGEVTTGTVKLAGLAATGLAAALLGAGKPATGGPVPAHAGQPGAGTRLAGPGPAVNVLVNAGLIAGGANLLNLFDLRPGRAIKVAALSAGLITAGGALAGGSAAAEPLRPPGGAGPGSTRTRRAGLDAVAGPAGAALALLPDDLGERAMLGDAGANALGAMLGAAAARALPGRVRIGLLAGIIALTVASEKVSFTRVIEASPPLRWLDLAGRRPPAPVLARQEP
jgi:UDP-GlcNAc:undecaprenyl-phosphate/decaprenyl-phosphate GlcNAc-1-phosphate transferase